MKRRHSPASSAGPLIAAMIASEIYNGMKTLSGCRLCCHGSPGARSFGFRFKVRACRETFSGSGQDGHADIIAIANLI